MSKKSKPTSFKRSFNPLPWFMGAALFMLVFFAYRPVASHSVEYIWDDNDYVSENENVHEPSGLANIWLHPSKSPQYYPMVFTTFWIEAQLGSGPREFHLVNILLHAANACLLWRILKRL